MFINRQIDGNLLVAMMLSRRSMNIPIAFLFALGFISLCFRRFFLDLDGLDGSNKCHLLLSEGRWSHELSSSAKYRKWNPRGCLMRSFTPEDLIHCVGRKNIIFVGDSTARQLFWMVASKMKHVTSTNTTMKADSHTNLCFTTGNASISFQWNPFLNSTESLPGIGGTRNGSQGPFGSAVHISDATYVIGAGLWYARYLDASYAAAFEKSVSQLGVANNSVFLPIIQPLSEKLDEERFKTLTIDRIRALNQHLKAFDKEKDFEVMWSTAAMAEGDATAFEKNGIHVVEEVIAAQADILVNLICDANSAFQNQRSSNYCCEQRHGLSSFQSLLLFFVLLGAVLCDPVTSRSSRSHTSYKFVSALRSSKLCYAIATLSAVVFYCYLADRTALFEKISKVVDQNLFLAMVGVTLAAGLFTVACSTRGSTSTKDQMALTHDEYFLTREQTEEWKGWMQIVILFYHYFGMSRVLWIYQIVRLFVGSYLFMTGFGHGVYLLKTNDYSFRRVLSVLMRQNLLSCTLAFVMGTSYDFYYFPALASLWFLITWVTMVRVSQDRLNTCDIGVRVALSMIVIRNMFGSEYFLTSILDTLPKIGMMKINVQEFKFRFFLDWQTPYYGMLVAALYVKNLEDHTKSKPTSWSPFTRTSTLRVPILLFAALVLTAYGTICKMFSTKYEYNRWHAFISPWPILAFISIRNSTPWLRQRHSQLFAWIGRISLETFVLQYHIWLAADTKGLLHLGIIDRKSLSGRSTVSSWTFWVEAVTITVLFLWVSSAVAGATAIVSKRILGSHESRNSGPLERKGHLPGPSCGAAASSIGDRSWVKPLSVLAILWLLNLLW